MEIQKERDGAKLTVALTGRLDAVTAIQFDKDISKSLNLFDKSVITTFSGVIEASLKVVRLTFVPTFVSNTSSDFFKTATLSLPMVKKP